MEIQKNFELRAVGNKIVLRQCLPPSYEMKTVLVADKYSGPLGKASFVLTKGKQKYVFCEAEHKLYQKIADDCTSYCGEILLNIEGNWYFWSDIQNDESLILLGEEIPETTFYFLNREVDKVYLNWLSYDFKVKVNTRTFQTLEVLRPDVLKGNLSFIDDICPDVFKGETETGTIYVSIQRSTCWSFSVGLRQTREIYKLIFSNKSSAKLMELEAWARDFLNEKRKEGFGVPTKISVTEKHVSGEEDLVVTLSIYHQVFRNIEILVNLSMIRKGEKNAYFVNSSEKNAMYSTSGKGVKLVDKKDSIALYVIKNLRADEFSANKKDAFTFTAVTVKKNVKLPT